MTEENDSPPAAEIDSEKLDVPMALRTRESNRHHELDPYAEIFNPLMELKATVGTYPDEAVDVGIGSERIEEIDGILREILRTVREEHEHALRWTLDPYDEMEE